jgi:MFS family permease
MKKKVLFAIFSCAFCINFYNMPAAILAYMFQSFPEIPQTTVMLVVTLPVAVSVIVSPTVGLILMKLSKKTILLIGIVLQLVCACTVILTNGTVFSLILISTILSGIAFSMLYTTTNSAITEYDTSDTVSKNIGMNTSFMSMGVMTVTFVAGILAQDGNWVKAFYSYFITIPVLIIAVVFLPGMKPKTKDSGSSPDVAANTIEETITGGSVATLVMLVVLYIFFFVGVFSLVLNYSSYVITEFQLGTSVEAGITGTLMSFGGVAGGLLVGSIVKIFKRFAATAAFAVYGLTLLTMILIPNLYLLYVVVFISGIASTAAMVAGITAASSSIKQSSVAVGIFGATLGVGGFLCPFIIAEINRILGGGFITNLWIGVFAFAICAVLGTFIFLRAEKTKVQKTTVTL